jgi:hypothetical protein
MPKSISPETELPPRSVSILRHTLAKAPQQTRPKTFLEQQPYIFAYGAAISVFSPTATAYQLSKLYNLKPTLGRLIRLSAPIFPAQTALKAIQMNSSTPVKEYLNPWAAFAVIGVLQGGVYGQCNVHFSRALELGKTVSLKGVFRGSAFAGSRDMISQGVPFMCSQTIRESLLDPIWKTEKGTTEDKAKQWTSVLSTSVVATYLSQGFHNFQISMQADQSLSYVQAVKSVTGQHGFKALYKGAEARVGLLLIVNVLNELLLKPAWAPVPMED